MTNNHTLRIGFELQYRKLSKETPERILTNQFTF